MKKTLAGCVVILMALFVSAGPGMAGNGTGGGSGARDGTGPVHDIFAGTPFTYAGTVVSLVPGQGLLLAVGDENVTIFGIGPVRYWASSGVERPAVGDSITVEGYAVDFSTVVRLIAVSITTGEDTLQLRDPDSGLPLWSSGAGR